MFLKITIQTSDIHLSSKMEKINKVWLPAQIPRTCAQATASDMPYKTLCLKRKLPDKGDALDKDACSAFCGFPRYVENEKSAAELLLLVLLVQIADLLVTQLSGMPLICLPAAPKAVSPVLSTILLSIQGPERWHGKSWNLRRPWIISPTLSFSETAPSSSITDYVGGKHKDYVGKSKFCFPYVNSAVALMPGLPDNVFRWFTQTTSLSCPIVFNSPKRDTSRPLLKIDPELLDSFDTEKLHFMFDLRELIFSQLLEFQCWLRKKPKRLESLLLDRDSFRPTLKRGRYLQFKIDDRMELICLSLAMFKQYLYFASAKAGWIAHDDAVEMLLYYQHLLLPESISSAVDSCKNQGHHGNYYSPAVFYEFLTSHFLSVYQDQIVLGTKGGVETVGLIRQIDEAVFFITPRKPFFEKYSCWLKDKGIPAFDYSRTYASASVQKELMDADIPMRHETNNPSTWRYQFYSSGPLINKLIDCVGLPLHQLPNSVQLYFADHFGGISELLPLQHQAEAPRISSERRNPL